MLHLSILHPSVRLCSASGNVLYAMHVLLREGTRVQTHPDPRLHVPQVQLLAGSDGDPWWHKWLVGWHGSARKNGSIFELIL